MRLRDNWAACQHVVSPLRVRGENLLAVDPRTRQHVFSTSDKARLVSVYAFDVDQSCSSRQHDFADGGRRMLQRNEFNTIFWLLARHGLPILILVQCNN
jgi:hypothetical protein